MSELIALVLASLPLLAFIVLVVETLRVGAGREPHPPVDLTYRAYDA